MRLRKFAVNKKELRAPFFIPSISEVALRFMPRLVPYVIKALQASNSSSIMLSVYDLTLGNFIIDWARPIIEEQQTIHASLGIDSETIVFLDSGGYEAVSYTGTLPWNDPLDVYSFQKIANADVFVVLDDPTLPSLSEEENKVKVQRTINFAKEVSYVHDSKTPLMAVAHGYDQQSLISCVDELLKIDNIQCIAIPAREPFSCPQVKRLETIAHVRDKIDSVNPEKVLHLLGCGKMYRWPLYVLCGADSIDATNWLGYIAQPQKWKWRKYGYVVDAKCKCEECQKHPGMNVDEVCKLGPIQRLCHNLNFTHRIMRKIRENLVEGRLHELAKRYEPKLYSKLEKTMRF